MKIKIVKDNKPSLRQKCSPVKLPLSSNDMEILYAMNDYLIKSQDEEYARKHNIRSGVGLAAPQIGINKRMFVVYIDSGEEIINYILVNPKIIETSYKMVALKDGEGCLSVDNEHNGLVHRHYKIKIEAFNLLTNQQEVITAEGYLAIVLQHEYDHLDGILYYDRIDPFNPNSPRPNETIL